MATQGGEIREGFLCPMCMKDLGTVTQLQSHFDEAHSTEDKVVLNQLRGLFDKAKKKFLGDKEEESGPGEATRASSAATAATQAVSLYDVDYWQPQDTGVTRSWTDTFRGSRDARVDKYVVETNKLLIRLDKLISPEVPSESGKRKVFEKSVVIWKPDSEVKACPFCMKSFGMMRRRHHCRLCGGIMCDKCSHFLTHAYAKKLTNPAFSFDAGRDQSFLKRSDSNSSLNSMFSSEGDPHIRSCNECRKLLERRDQLMEQRNTKSTIELLYDKLKSCIHECDKLLDTFLPMVKSLSLGEPTHNLRAAQHLRGELVKQYEIIDKIRSMVLKEFRGQKFTRRLFLHGNFPSLSILQGNKRIAILDMDKEDGISQKQVILQKSIRAYSANFMQENMMGLQNLPSEEQYAALQAKRSEAIQREIALERQATFQAQEEEKRQYDRDHRDHKHPGSPTKEDDSSRRDRAGSHKRQDSASSKGWIPAEHKVKVNSSSDPMLQQMEIIRGYIRQARQAEKWDEVKMLEQNLKDLHEVYSSQQKQTWS